MTEQEQSGAACPEEDLRRGSRNLGAWGAGLAGGVLAVLGVLHVVLGVPSLRRAVERGNLAPQLAGPQMVNWLFSGGTISLLGALLVLSVPELRRGRRAAWRSALSTGVYFLLVGVAAYAWVPRADVLIFAIVGLCVAAPLALGRRAFNEP